MRKIKSILPIALFLGIFLICCEEDDPPDPRDNFVGTFLMTEAFAISATEQISYSYNIDISKSRTNGAQILISNVGDIIGPDRVAAANVSSNLFTIPTQTIQYLTMFDSVTIGLSELTINGSGKLSGNTLDMDYTINGTMFECTGVKM